MSYEEKKERELRELEERIGYSFRDRSLLRTAVTHSSYANELSRHIGEAKNNERLEFLGDAVLELVTSEFIFHHHKEMPEGKLSKLRASMVCEPSLAICARDLSLGDFLLLGKGEDVTGGRNRDSILSDAFEAVIGAIYLDGGIAPAAGFIRRWVLQNLEQAQLFKDSKTVLQEMVQKTYQRTPEYELVEERGPAHRKEFEFCVRVGERVLATGTGPSKKAAEQEAALKAIRLLQGKGTTDVSKEY